MDASTLRKEHREMTEQKRILSEQLNRTVIRKEPKVFLFFFCVYKYFLESSAFTIE